MSPVLLWCDETWCDDHSAPRDKLRCFLRNVLNSHLDRSTRSLGRFVDKSPDVYGHTSKELHRGDWHLRPSFFELMYTRHRLDNCVLLLIRRSNWSPRSSWVGEKQLSQWCARIFIRFSLSNWDFPYEYREKNFFSMGRKNGKRIYGVCVTRLLELSQPDPDWPSVVKLGMICYMINRWPLAGIGYSYPDLVVMNRPKNRVEKELILLNRNICYPSSICGMLWLLETLYCNQKLNPTYVSYQSNFLSHASLPKHMTYGEVPVSRWNCITKIPG